MVVKRAEPLSRERILEAALAILDRDGLDALTMRKLGDALGVEAMSLYNHVPNKNALLDGIHERILARVPAVPPRARDWKSFARHAARSLHATLCAHPNAIALFATRPAATTASFARLEQYLTVLRDAGFSALQAMRVVQIILAYVVGHALWTVGTADDGLPDAESQQEFEMGLDALLRGLASA
jgi:TetR/AcrR family transcriptional regulator, tetracycline repressor protein